MGGDTPLFLGEKNRSVPGERNRSERAKIASVGEGTSPREPGARENHMKTLPYYL